MNDSTPNFTQEDFQAARDSVKVKAGVPDARIEYTLDGQPPKSFNTEGVSGGLSQTLIFERVGGDDVGLAWRYVTPGLQDGEQTFEFKKLPNAVFAIRRSEYSEVLGGTLVVHVESIVEDGKETATITGTITDAEFGKVTDEGDVTSTVTVNGRFTYLFPAPL